MTWRDYHEATKHSVESLRRAPHYLDWDTMPDPFRNYEGVPVLDLPADPPDPAKPAPGGPAFLSQLLYYSAAISAAKRVPSTGYKYALRVNPSSGNLHPTEFHFLTQGVRDWPDGIYHYRAASHMAEQRGCGGFPLAGFPAPIVFLLTSIAWREAWKYRARAYRYCLLDVGHAAQSLELAAGALGCNTKATVHFADRKVAQHFRLPDEEWPMLILEVENGVPRANQSAAEPVWFGGIPNRLSPSTIDYPLIPQIHQATVLEGAEPISDPPAPGPQGSGEIQLPAPAVSARPFGETVRRRRSALDFQGGDRTMPLNALAALLRAAMPLLQFVQLYLYAHRIDGLGPGLYRHWPARGQLELLLPGDQTVAAAGLSLGQDLAGNACVAFSMVADMERAARTYGARAYRYVHFEAGAVGQRFYFTAESLNLRATGIGAFFDDRVHHYLNLEPDGGQVIYHFAIGHAVHDPRIEA